MKLVVLGGGGVRSPFLAKSIVSQARKLGLRKIVFYDNDPKKLNIYGTMAQIIAGKIDGQVRFELETDPIRAIENGHYFITTLRVGQDQARIMDEKIALKYQVLGQETTGVGGFAMALRSIPALISYCEMIRQYGAEQTYVFNFTNPSGLVTQALRDAGYSNVYGICDSPSEFYKEIRALYQAGEDEFSAECFGLNHLSWFRKIKIRGQDKTHELLEKAETYLDTEQHLFEPKLVQMHGMLLNGYLYFYYYREKALASILQAEKTRGETIYDINTRMNQALKDMDLEKEFEAAFKIYLQHYYERENSYMAIESGNRRKRQISVPSVQDFIDQEDEGGYAGVALKMINALQNNKPVEMVLSVPNEGAIEGLEPDDVIEVTCQIGHGLVKPKKIGRIDPLQMNLIRQIKYFERSSVEAIKRKDRQMAIQGLMGHPLVNSYSLAQALVNDYLSEYKEFVGEWS